MIDKADSEDVYEAVLLGYGLCGNSTAGLKARRQPLVIPRAHDCCTLFLGSREKFAEHFGKRLSSQWSSHGYLERSVEYLGGTETGRNIGYDREYADLVEQYGEENAEYIWETLHPARNIGKDERIYIDVAPFDSAEEGDYHFARFHKAVIGEASGSAHDSGANGVTSGPGVTGTTSGFGASSVSNISDVPAVTAVAAVSDVPASSASSAALPPNRMDIPEIRRLEGSARLVDMLLDGDWGDDFLVIPPGMTIAAVYDMEQVVMCLPADTKR
jgi:hypothetical protein